MIIHKGVRSKKKPENLKIDNVFVYISKNIQPFEDESNEGFEYDLEVYDKNEYLALISEENKNLQQQLLDTQMAICNIYETLEGKL